METRYEVQVMDKKADYGSIIVPGSKSITNRALCLAAFAEGKSVLTDILLSDDTENCIESIRSLGVETHLDRENKKITIHGAGKKLKSGSTCYVGSAGTAARFLTAMLTMLPEEFTIDASAQMRGRPMEELLNVLEGGGAEFEYLEKEKHLPYIKKAGKLKKNKFVINCNKSSQFLSGMLMAGALSEVDLELEVADFLVAKPYIDITIKLLQDFGVEVENRDYKTFIVRGGQTLKACTLPIEPDVSSACYFFSIPAVLGGTIILENIFYSSIQGDIKFLEVLKMMGCTIEETEKGIRVSHSGTSLKGIDVDMNEYSDQAITAAVLGALASEPVRIRNIGHIKHQESNRVQASINELAKVGIKVEEMEDGIIVYPGPINGAEIDTYDDHRIAMSFSLLGLVQPGIIIKDHLCCRKTFPNYFDVLETLY